MSVFDALVQPHPQCQLASCRSGFIFKYHAITVTACLSLLPCCNKLFLSNKRKLSLSPECKDHSKAPGQDESMNPGPWYSLLIAPSHSCSFITKPYNIAYYLKMCMNGITRYSSTLFLFFDMFMCFIVLRVQFMYSQLCTVITLM